MQQDVYWNQRLRERLIRPDELESGAMAMFDKLGDALVLAREKYGLRRQKEAARHLGVTAQQISEWEGGKKTPSLQTLGRILEAYRLTLAEFEVYLDEVNRRPNERLTQYEELARRVAAIEEAIARGEQPLRAER